MKIFDTKSDPSYTWQKDTDKARKFIQKHRTEKKAQSKKFVTGSQNQKSEIFDAKFF